jgi:hypothetical protein
VLGSREELRHEPPPPYRRAAQVHTYCQSAGLSDTFPSEAVGITEMSVGERCDLCEVGSASFPWGERWFV